jgi:hypothetical protein
MADLLRYPGWEASMPKATVQKYPPDETVLHSAIEALVEYFDQIAETARNLADREQPERAVTDGCRSQQRSRTVTRD